MPEFILKEVLLFMTRIGYRGASIVKLNDKSVSVNLNLRESNEVYIDTAEEIANKINEEFAFLSVIIRNNRASESIFSFGYAEE